MIKRFSAVAALVAILAPVVAHAKVPTVFEHAGQRYFYTTKQTYGRTFIRGYVEKGFAPFELTIRNGRVSGTVNGRPVSFRVADVDKAQIAAEIAAR